MHATAPTAPPPAGWRHVVDRWNAYAVDLPDSWKSFSDGDRFVATCADDLSTAVLLWPMALERPAHIEEVTLQAVRAIANGEPGFEAWTPPSSQGEGRRRVLFRRRSARGAALRGEVVVALRGERAALVRAYQCPEAEVAATHALARRIAWSFSLVEGVAREHFVEPGERAFSFDYPRGWRASGRVDRARTPQGGGVVTWCVEDPRSGARVQNEGVMIPLYEPSPMAMFGGGLVHPYCDAPAFCRGVLLDLARRAHPDLRLDRVDPSPEVEALARRSLVPVERKLRAPATASGALAWTRYTEGGVAFRECAVVTTWIVRAPPDPMAMMMGVASPNAWFGTVGPTFRAREGDFDEALPVLRGVADSFKNNDAWEQREVDQVSQRMDREAAAAARQRAQTLRETADYIRNVEREIAERHAATNAEVARVGYNTVMGKEDVLDADGQSYKVDTGYDAYWAKDDRIVGSSSSDFDAHLQSDGWRRMRVF